MTTSTPRPKPQGGDVLRAIGYLTLAAWSVIFMIYPPEAFRAALDDGTRFLWLGATLVGAIVATVGSFTRIDYKVELPGMAVILIGPIFYCASQVYYITHPSDAAMNPEARYALAVYAIVPAVQLLPRIWELYSDSRKIRRLAKALKDGVLSKGANQ